MSDLDKQAEYQVIEQVQYKKINNDILAIQLEGVTSGIDNNHSNTTSVSQNKSSINNNLEKLKNLFMKNNNK